MILNKTLRGFIKKEFRQALRDPRMRTLLFVAPMIQMILFGVALSNEVKGIRLTTQTKLADTALEHIYQHSIASGWFVPAHPSQSDPFKIIADDEADAVLVAPPEGLTASIEKGRGSLQLLVNASNVIRAQGIEQYVNANIATVIAEDFPKLVRPSPIQFDVRIIANPMLETSIYMVPGVICMIVLLITINLTSMSLVKEKEVGTFEMLISAPIKSWEVILGKTLPYLIIGLINIPLILSVAVAYLGVPMHGSILILGITAMVFVATTVAVGILISTVAQNQQQAMMGGFFFIFASNMLSGTMVPIENMPTLMRYLAYCDPLTHFVLLCRNIMLKGGSDFEFLTIHIGALTIMAGLAIALSFQRFKTELR